MHSPIREYLAHVTLSAYLFTSEAVSSSHVRWGRTQVDRRTSHHEMQASMVGVLVVPVGALVGSLVPMVGVLVKGTVGDLVVGFLVVAALVFVASCDVTQILNSFTRTWPVTWLLK